MASYARRTVLFRDGEIASDDRTEQVA